MAVQGALWLAKRLSLNLNFSFLNRISVLLIQIATQLSSRGWVDPVPDPTLPEKFQGYSRESNPGSLGYTSYLLLLFTIWTLEGFPYRHTILHNRLLSTPCLAYKYHHHHYQCFLPKGRSFIASESTKVAVLPKTGLPPENSGTKVADLPGMNRCGSFPMLSAPHSLSLSLSLFSI